MQFIVLKLSKRQTNKWIITNTILGGRLGQAGATPLVQFRTGPTPTTDAVTE